jgi:hypothetical protein
MRGACEHSSKRRHVHCSIHGSVQRNLCLLQGEHPAYGWSIAKQSFVGWDSAGLYSNPEKALAMTDQNPRSHFGERICIRTFTLSALMLGICLTVTGVLRIATAIQRADVIAENLLVINAILFLFSCVWSYGVLRSRSIRQVRFGKHLAEYVFSLALLLMVAICGFIAYAIALH